MATAKERRGATKVCNICGEEKPEEEYFKWFSGIRQRYRRSPYCHPCRKVRQKEKSRERQYGLTKDDYENLVESQNGNCAICKIPLEDTWKSCIDHCHESGVVRGILCNHCNTMLGQAKDNVETLRSAIKYLKARD